MATKGTKKVAAVKTNVKIAKVTPTAKKVGSLLERYQGRGVDARNDNMQEALGDEFAGTIKDLTKMSAAEFYNAMRPYVGVIGYKHCFAGLRRAGKLPR